MATRNHYDAVVIGAGAAGLMCAMTASHHGCRVLVIDHNKTPGNKILISGGGRCNFTNRKVGAENFLSQNPHFAKSALQRFTPNDFIDLVNKHGITWHEKTLGQLFCDGSSRQIVDLLMDECARGKVEFQFGHPVEEFTSTANGSGFHLKCGGQAYYGSTVVLASGGLSIPKLGASGFAYEIARQFKLKIVDPRPALVSLKLGPEEALFRELSGVASTVIATADKGMFSEAALFTHKGLSGPAILQVSSFWKPGKPVQINFVPDVETGWLLQQKRQTPSKTVQSILSQVLPQRLADALCRKQNIDQVIGTFSDHKIELLRRSLANWLFHPTGSEGFAKAEVTIGGVSTDELSSKTMESNKISGLYIIGEAVDVTGWLGGYNFQWAWASGHAAGKAIAQTTSKTS